MTIDASTLNQTGPEPVRRLRELGTSVWLDDLSRERLRSGNLTEIISGKGVVGVTTNPAIFAAAMGKGTAYDEQIAQLAAEGTPAVNAVFAMAADDVRDACDAFAEIFEATDGLDGRVSLEVDPRLAHDREATVAQARELADKVGRPNVMIKIPATEECLPAISDVLAEGISVNVTLIFSVSRYRQVCEAFLDGLEAAERNGKDLSAIHSVASFFVSRVDTEVDRRLNEIGHAELCGQAALANARLAYAAFQDALLENPRWQELEAKGARVQRPLWASTSVKNPEYPDTLYVDALAGPQTVNTMPEATLDAVIEHSEADEDLLSDKKMQAELVFQQLDEAGVDLCDVWQVLEREGVQKFIDSWEELLATVDEQLKAKKGEA
ncbi:transaldolase [uncultured Corynebacterium sp.]|uniref:transaldolase n=1 Tax=uncultured Corynebacterium sp. TaxID=159447 RepID=UPI0025F4CB8A|nr:transaldolase [uncultured Corynebacterium sp.]